MVLLASVGHYPAFAAFDDSTTGFAPFASYTYTYDSNLLNRPSEGLGPAPQSDQIDRFEVGSHINFRLSRQKFSGTFSLSDIKHTEFEERNLQGNSHRLRWDSEIGKTLIVSVEGSAMSDQAPIQTGLVSAIQRDQENATATVTWNLHPEYALLSQIARTETRFISTESNSDSDLAGLNRDDELVYIGVEYHPGTGSSISLLQKKSSGYFPIRQITGPSQSVSNDFNQNETELLTKWNYSEITALTVSLSSVEREHAERQSRNFSGTNYRLEFLYKPTEKTNLSLSLGKQIIGVSDATNSDALARQLFVSMNTQITSKLVLRLAYRPQNLTFDGTDGFAAEPRTEKIEEVLAGLEYRLSERSMLGTLLRNRSRNSSLENTDYSANSFSAFIKYDY